MSQQYAKDQPSSFKNRIEKIAVVGVGGHIGSFIVKHLLAANRFQVTAITREASTTSLPAGVQRANVDYDNSDTVVAALKGHDALVVSLGHAAGPGAHNMLYKAASDAGVPWIVPNEWGFDTDNDAIVDDIPYICHERRKNRMFIDSLPGVSWTGVTCGFWYEWGIIVSPEMFGFDVTAKKATFFDKGEQRMDMSSFDQSGLAVARLLSLPILPTDETDNSTTLSKYRNRAINVSSFRLNQREILESLERVTGEKFAVKYEPSRDRWARNFEPAKKGNIKAFVAVMYARLFFPDGAGLYGDRHGLDNEKLGLPEEDLDECTRRAMAMLEAGSMPRF